MMQLSVLFLFVFLSTILSVCSLSFVPSAPNFEVKDRIVNKRTDVICVGEVLFDCIADEDCGGLSFEQVEAAGKFQKYPGGAPANVACALSKLGVRSMFAGALGGDEEGEELQKMFSSNNVETLCSVSKFPTRKVTVTRTNAGERQFSGFYGDTSTELYADCHYDPPVSAKWLANNAVMGVVTGTLGLYPEDSPTSKMMRKLKEEVMLMRDLHSKGDDAPDRERAPLFVVDFNLRDVFWGDTDENETRRTILQYIRGVDIVKLTDEEAEWAFNIDPQKALRDPQCLMNLLEPREGVLVTGGERGCSCYFRGGGLQRLPAFAVDTVDTTGAGDAFTAGFLSALAMGTRSSVLRTSEGLLKALRMASAAGALTCTKTGAIAAQPTLPEVIQLLISNNVLQ